MLTAAEPLIETRFRAMGTDVHIAVVGVAPNVLHVAEQRIRDLERRWSRFLDIQRDQHPQPQPRPTRHRVPGHLRRSSAERSRAWHATGGRFDPTVGVALAAHGYDRDFTDVARVTSPAVVAIAPAPGPADIDLLPDINAITLPDGVTIDPGGIGKGLAADLTAQLLLASGADGALVNLGGDLRATGRAPSPEGWAVTVDDPIDTQANELLRLAMPEGAVATSSRLLRRWQTTAGEAHHLIDPATGRPAQTDVVAVTVVAGEAWWAEALTKALFLAGPDRPRRDRRPPRRRRHRRRRPPRHARPRSDAAMNPQTWWYLARATGYVAWALLTTSVISGLLLSTRLTNGRPTPAWILDLHRFLAGTAVAFTGLHIVGLVADNYVHFGAADLLVPFASDVANRPRRPRRHRHVPPRRRRDQLAAHAPPTPASLAGHPPLQLRRVLARHLPPRHRRHRRQPPGVQGRHGPRHRHRRVPHPRPSAQRPGRRPSPTAGAA